MTAVGQDIGVGYRVLNALHRAMVFNRRVQILAGHFAESIPQRGTVLDIGTGDGVLAVALMGMRPDLQVQGVDVLARPDALIPVTIYDGRSVPFPDQSFDYVLISDVLHHTDDPATILSEAARVARVGIVVKDHLREGFMAEQTLRFMDWVGNRGHNVVLPYNYLSRDEWQVAYYKAKLTTVSSKERLGLYPPPFSWFFERKLHFVAFLAPRERLA
jgi:ubiquinone/menaquinone biosynthesis C-methylase UbiE